MWLSKPSVGITEHGLLSGLSDDDHLQYLLRNVLTIHGDIFTRNGSNIVRRAPDTDGKVLTTHNTGKLPTWESIPSMFGVVQSKDYAYGIITSVVLNNDNIYFMAGSSHIIKLKSSDLSYTANFATANKYSLAIDNNYLYYVGYNGHHIYRLDLATFSSESSLEILNVGGQHFGQAVCIRRLAINSVTNKLWATFDTGFVAKVDTATFTQDGQVDCGNDHNRGLAIDEINDKIYISGEISTEYPWIYKVDGATISVDANLGLTDTGGSGAQRPDIYVCECDRERQELYCAGYGSLHKNHIYVVDLNTFQEKYPLKYDIGDGRIMYGCISPSTGYVYLGTYNPAAPSPCNIFAVKEKGFIIRAILRNINPINSGYNGLCIAYNSNTDMFYVGSENLSNNSRLIQLTGF